MSKKAAADQAKQQVANQASRAESQAKAVKRPLNLSITDADKGFLLQPDGEWVASALVDHLLDKVEDALVQSSVEARFKGYAVGLSLSSALNAMTLSHITNDLGDAAPEMAAMLDYDYAAECEEPPQPTPDNLAR